MNEFTEEKLKEIREAFDLYDSDNDNYINREQLEKVSLCLGYNFKSSELDNILHTYGEEVNTNDKYIISYSRFSFFLTKQSREIEMENELMDCFIDLDKDGDGKITVKELKYAFLTMGEHFEDEELQEIINQVDTTGQGAFSYKDFVKLMLNSK
jgi:Ca2+-binding EF-hand superfamily protein